MIRLTALLLLLLLAGACGPARVGEPFGRRI